MSFRQWSPPLLLVALVALVVLGGVRTVRAGDCPYLIRPSEVTMEIAEVKFVEAIQGQNGVVARVPQEKLDNFRIAVATIRVRKPAGKRLTLAAADLTLHYNHGNSHEVAPCEGISSFSRNADDERDIRINSPAGPGWIKQTTGVRATEATEVYFDAVFHLIERTICEMWLCVGQPTTERARITSGW